MSVRPLLSSGMVLLTLGLSGCFSAVSLNKVVVAYDEAVTDALSKQLLVNIARAEHRQPMHFTGVSNVAATFDFRVSGGITPAFTGPAGTTLAPLGSGSVAENPTISIVPIEGEEFTKRLLTPFEESKLLLMLRQGVDIDLLLRLMAAELRLKQNGREVAFRNLPSDKPGYEMFRRVVLHLSAIQDQNHLYAEPMVYEQKWIVPVESVKSDGFDRLKDEDIENYDREKKTYEVRKRIVGRILITNYDPDTLPIEERARMSHEAQDWPPNDVTFDIRPGYPGGDWPLKGDFRLRSFRAILTAIGLSLSDEQEYDVAPDKRTPPVLENPVHTLEIMTSEAPPLSADRSIHTHGKFYAVQNEGLQARWNRLAFQLMYLLYQMTITDVPRQGAPLITISK